MRHRRCLAPLSDEALLQDLRALLAREHENTAAILAHLAEVETRKLYVPEGYDSLRAYCIHVLHMSDDEAGRRIHVANKSRQVPALLDAIADGRLHLTGASLIAPHITAENADELLAAGHPRDEDRNRVPRRLPVPASGRSDASARDRAAGDLLCAGTDRQW